MFQTITQQELSQLGTPLQVGQGLFEVGGKTFVSDPIDAGSFKEVGLDDPSLTPEQRQLLQRRGGIQVDEPTREPVLIDTGDFRADARVNLEKLEKQALSIQENLRKIAEREAAEKEQAERVDAAPPPSVGDVLGEPELTSEQQTQRDELQRQSEELQVAEQDLNRRLDQFEIQGDAQTAALVSQIKARFAERRRQQEDVNKRSLAALQQLGIRTGAARRAGSFTGILSAEETAGLNRITELDRQEQEIILAAQVAVREEKFDVLQEKITQAEAKREEINREINKFNEAIIKKNEEIRERAVKLSRQSTIIDLVSQGITDPSELFDLVNFDERGNLIGDITIGDITDVLDSIRVKESEPISLSDLGKINNELELNLPFGTTEKDLVKMGIVPQGGLLADFEFKTLGNKILKVNKDTGETSVVFQGAEGDDPITAQQRFQNTFSFAKNVEDNSKTFIGVRDASNRVEASAKDPSAAGDLSLIFNFMKILDPGSVVREGEFANAQNSAGIPERIRAKYNSVIAGERLSDKTRKDFLDRSRRLFTEQLESQVIFQSQQIDIAESFALDPFQAVPDLTLLKRKLQGQLQPGEIMIWDIESRQIGFIPESEFDRNKHIIF